MSTIIQQVKDIVALHGIDVKVAARNLEGGIAAYNLAKHTIYVNVEQLETHDFNDSPVTQAQMIELIIAHELGHVVDPKIRTLNKTKTDLAYCISRSDTIDELESYTEVFESAVLERETNAFVLGKQFVSEELQDHFLTMNRKNIVAYKKELARLKEDNVNKMMDKIFNVMENQLKLTALGKKVSLGIATAAIGFSLGMYERPTVADDVVYKKVVAEPGDTMDKLVLRLNADNDSVDYRDLVKVASDRNNGVSIQAYETVEIPVLKK